MKIHVTYYDEHDSNYKTLYSWYNDSNEFPMLNLKSKIIILIGIILIALTFIKLGSDLFLQKPIETREIPKADFQIKVPSTDTITSISDKAEIKDLDKKQSIPEVTYKIIQQPKETVYVQSEKPNVVISSENQSGGITAQEVNIRAKIPVLTENNKKELLTYLPKDKSERISIMALSGNSNSYNIGKEIHQFLSINGYNLGKEIGIFQQAPVIEGIKVGRDRKNIFTIYIGLLN